ncbi:hypothetical protein BT69DRAFT_1346404 [Atractiella rhizophila]|nr:hypothetical protein BT69DRAFT_1346404 [Atractiella rhizophila]
MRFLLLPRIFNHIKLAIIHPVNVRNRYKLFFGAKPPACGWVRTYVPTHLFGFARCISIDIFRERMHPSSGIKDALMDWSRWYQYEGHEFTFRREGVGEFSKTIENIVSLCGEGIVELRLSILEQSYQLPEIFKIPVLSDLLFDLSSRLPNLRILRMPFDSHSFYPQFYELGNLSRFISTFQNVVKVEVWYGWGWGDPSQIFASGNVAKTLCLLPQLRHLILCVIFWLKYERKFQWPCSLETLEMDLKDSTSHTGLDFVLDILTASSKTLRTFKMPRGLLRLGYPAFQFAGGESRAPVVMERLEKLYFVGSHWHLKGHLYAFRASPIKSITLATYREKSEVEDAVVEAVYSILGAVEDIEIIKVKRQYSKAAVPRKPGLLDFKNK